MQEKTGPQGIVEPLAALDITVFFRVLAYKIKLLETDSPIEAAIVDAAECEIERLEKTAKLLLRKKEKSHFQITDHSRHTDAGHHLHFNSNREKA